MANDADDEARKVAEAAMPGWRALSPEEEQPASDAPAADQAEKSGADLDALRRRYLGDSAAPRDAASAPARAGGDVQFVTLAPRDTADAPIRTRKVIVSGKKVIGFQG
jgi:hypothetical protein